MYNERNSPDPWRYEQSRSLSSSQPASRRPTEGTRICTLGGSADFLPIGLFSEIRAHVIPGSECNTMVSKSSLCCVIPPAVCVAHAAVAVRVADFELVLLTLVFEALLALFLSAPARAAMTTAAVGSSSLFLVGDASTPLPAWFSHGEAARKAIPTRRISGRRGLRRMRISIDVRAQRAESAVKRSRGEYKREETGVSADEKAKWATKCRSPLFPLRAASNRMGKHSADLGRCTVSIYTARASIMDNMGSSPSVTDLKKHKKSTSVSPPE